MHAIVAMTISGLKEVFYSYMPKPEYYNNACSTRSYTDVQTVNVALPILICRKR